MPLKLGEKYKLPEGEFHTVQAVGDDPVMYMYVYQNSTEIEWRKKYKILTEIDDHREKSPDKPLPANLTVWTPEEEAKIRQYFFGNQTVDEIEKIKIAKRQDVIDFKQTYYAQMLFWLDKRMTHIRRGALVVGYAIKDLIFSQDIENLQEIFTERSKVLNEYESPFFKTLKENIDSIKKQKMPKDDAKIEL